MIGRRHAGHPVAVSMPGDHGRPGLFAIDHERNIAREVLQTDTFQRPGAAAGAARLRPQHAKTGAGDAGRDLVKILQIASTRRQQNDERTAALGDQIDGHVIISDDFARSRRLHSRRRCIATEDHGEDRHSKPPHRNIVSHEN